MSFNVARLSSLWRAIVGTRDVTALTGVGELRPYVCLASPESEPDLYVYGGVRLWAFEDQTAAGGAGTFSHIFVVNPVGSGVVSVLTSWSLGKDSTTAMFMGPRHRTNGVPPVNPAAATQRAGAILVDQRLAKASVPRATTQIWDLVDAVGSYRSTTFSVIGGVGVVQPGPVILGPGDAVVFDAETNNTLGDIVVRGYERDLQPGELGLNI